MKKLIALFLLILCFKANIAQPPIIRAQASNTVEDYNLFTLTSFRPPVFIDTTAANLVRTLDSCGKIIYTYTGNTLWYRGCSPKKWLPVSGGSGSSGWDLFGNTLTNPLAFLGSINNYDLNFGTSNLKRFSLDKDGIKAYNSDVMPWGIDTTDGKLAYSIIPTSYIQNALIGDTAFVPLSSNSYLFKSDVWGYGLLSANNSDTTKGAKVDTANSITSRLQAQHLIDSLAATISGGGSQTPWPSTEDAARHSLVNLKSLQIWVIDSTSGSVTYATLNPSDKGTDASLSGGNLIIQNTGAANASARATVSKSSGKWYWETKLTNKNDNTVGFGDGTMNVNDIVGNDVHGWSLYTNTSGYIIHNGGFTGLSTSFATNDVIGFALDLGTGTCDIYQNNVFLYQITGITGTIFPAVGQATTVGIVTCNFGATTLAYTPPAGYNAGVYSTSGSVTYDTTTVFQTDSLTKRVGINQIPDAVFKLAVGGAVKFNDDSLYIPNLPSGVGTKAVRFNASTGKFSYADTTLPTTSVPLSGITRGTATNIVSNAGNVFGIDSTSAIIFYGGNNATTIHSAISTSPNLAYLRSDISGNAAQVFTQNVPSGIFNKKVGAALMVGSSAFYVALDSNHIKLKGDSISVVGGLPTGVGTKAVRIDANGRLFQADTTTSGSSLAIGSTITSATAGSVLFVGTGGKLMQKNSDFFYDSTNKRLGIGTAVPSDMVHLKGASSNGLTVEGSQPMITLNATSNDPQITLTRAGNSSNMYVNSSTQLIVQGYNEVKVQQSGTTGFGIFSYVGGSFNSAFSIGSISNPTSTLQSYGTFSAPTVTKTGTYTATDYDYTILCSTNTFTINLPALSGITGRIYVIKNITTATTITVDGNASETIDGSTTYSLAAQYKFVMIQAGVSEWNVIGSN